MAFNLIKQVLKVVILVWMPLTAPYAAISCPSHISSDGDMQMMDSMGSLSDHCEKHGQQQEQSDMQSCDCPTCALSTLIPLVSVLQLEELPKANLDFVALRYRNIHLTLDTPPPQ